jgi:SNF2 family DNA or RNA helicase
MKTFGTLEYTIDKYSGSWTWKITGVRAVMMVSKLIPELWYGSGPNEVIIPDNEKNVKQIRLILERYPLEILSKAVWQRKTRTKIIKKSTNIKIEKLSKAIPKKQFRGKLLNFQKMGLDFLLKSSGNALLADDMGLGKTVQTLAYIASEKQSLPALIVAPLVTLTNWQREIEKFMKKKSKNGRIVENDVPTITAIRSGKRSEIFNYDFYLINYELLHKRQADLAKLNIKTIVCDEVQHLRSKTTQKYRAVKTLASIKSIKYRVGLSGTPIYNHGSEIWPIVDILKPGLLGNFKEFCEYFCYQDEKGKAIVVPKKRVDLRQILQRDVMLRRKKSDVLKELKDKVRYKNKIDVDETYYEKELTKIDRRFIEEERYADTEFKKSRIIQTAIQSERLAAGVAKLPHVIDFVKNIMEIEESVVVFCHHRDIHKLLHEKLQEFNPSSIIGGQRDKDRQDNIDRFQNGDTRLIVVGLRAGNLGINLTRAKYVIFAELDWSPAIHRQAEDRLHRIGQKNTVFAYYLIGKRTLDEHVADILVGKSYEIDAIMDATYDPYENKEKAKLILAQIHDRLHTK